MPINVFVTDDLNLVRRGLCVLLEKECDVTVVGSAADGYECISAVNKLKPNIVILDVDMPDINGIKTLQIMKEQKFNVKTIMMTSNDNRDSIVKAMELGCDAYISKNCDVSVLKKAIFAAYNGERFLQEELAEKLNSPIGTGTNAADRLSELTSREIEVLKLIAEGLFNKEIAVKLNISERTVKNHVSNIFKKIQANDRTQAAVFAIRHGLIVI